MIPQEELAVDEVSDTPTKVLHLIPGENCKSFREHKQTKVLCIIFSHLLSTILILRDSQTDTHNRRVLCVS